MKLDRWAGEVNHRVMKARLLSKSWTCWSVRILGSAALVVCLWLLSRKWSGEITSLAGCGGEGGCSQVMGGRWSEWFHLPVTLLAASMYAGLLVLTLRPLRRWSGRDAALTLTGVVLAGVAGYFLTVLYAVERRHCPWCLGLHLTGLTVAGLLLVDAVGTLGRAALVKPGLVGGGALLLLGVGQIWGPRPQTWLLTGGSAVVPEMPPAAPAMPREVRFLDGQLVYHTDRVPMSGPPGARLILLEFFDYTCNSCRTLAGDLKALQKKWPGTFGVIALPSPLNRACNPDLKPQVPDHEGACELAKLSLAVWKAKPAAFTEYHDYLIALPLPANKERLAEARRKAAALAGGEAVVAALNDPAVAQQLSDNITAYRRLTTQSIVMPKLLLPSSGVMHGLAQDTATFIRVMETQLKLTAPTAAK